MNIFYTILISWIVSELVIFPFVIAIYVKLIFKKVDSKLDEIEETLHSIDDGIWKRV
jgi:uncharacterized protein YoxC